MRILRAATCLGALATMAAAASANTVTVYIYSFDFSMNHSGQPVVDPTINVGDTIH